MERQLESQIKAQTPNKYMKNLKKGGKKNDFLQIKILV